MAKNDVLEEEYMPGGSMREKMIAKAKKLKMGKAAKKAGKGTATLGRHSARGAKIVGKKLLSGFRTISEQAYYMNEAQKELKKEGQSPAKRTERATPKAAQEDKAAKAAYNKRLKELEDQAARIFRL